MTTYPISERKNKVKVADFASPAEVGRSAKDLLDAFPKILAGKDFRELVDAIQEACLEHKPVIVMMGAHVIKCGLSPVIIDLIQRGIISAIAMNGAGAIHDVEIALIGATSESVEENLPLGKFGMWEETGRVVNEAINGCQHKADKMGRFLALKLMLECPYSDQSILVEGFRKGIPVTVHVAIGTDITHQHPNADGAAIGRGSLADFRCFVDSVAKLESGGVVLNFGSAVILPEVFLKAMNIAINRGHSIGGFTTANFDFVRQYRAFQNVCDRPRLLNATTYNFIGHHEIMIPLLAQAVVDALAAT